TLAESKYYHADGTFHTKTRYMGQMYVIHAYFPYKDFENDDLVWVKRMIPCAWFFMRRRRIKDYIKILLALKKEAQNYYLELNPLYVMMDFEIAAKKGFEYVFPSIIVRGCLFHFGQTLFKNLMKIGLKHGQFTVRMWNHFDNSYKRTNNRVEGDNNKMKRYCGGANPNIDKAVRLLQQYESASSDNYKNAKKNS
ncbi:unnamed protein product, partial [Brachionus calyciflorus]